MLKPLGYARHDDLSAVVGLNEIGSGVPAGARYALLAVEGASARWRDDGQAPSASVGFPLYAGEHLQYAGDLYALRLVEMAAGCVLHVMYYKN